MEIYKGDSRKNNCGEDRTTNLIKEKYAWCARPCTTKQCPNCLLTFSPLFIQKFRALTNYQRPCEIKQILSNYAKTYVD